jgi:Mg-chelatase subunit ChlD
MDNDVVVVILARQNTSNSLAANIVVVTDGRLSKEVRPKTSVEECKVSLEHLSGSGEVLLCDMIVSIIRIAVQAL